MTRAQHLIDKLNEAGGLEPTDATTMEITGRRAKKPMPKGVGDLTRSQGFNYGSAGKKNKDMADSETEDNNVDSPVLVGNMFKRDASQDKDASNKRRPVLSPMSGLRG